MELEDFHRDLVAQVQAEVAQRIIDGGSPYAETVFAEIAMAHMADCGMTSDPQPCHYSGKSGNANLRLSGFALTEEHDELDLFVCDWHGGETVVAVPDADLKTLAGQCVKFLKACVEDRLAAKMDQSNDAYVLAYTVEQHYREIEQVRIWVLTDRKAKSKAFQTVQTGGKDVRLEVMDIERLHRHLSEGKPRDELVVNFTEVTGEPLPCIYVPGETTGYDYALAVVPAEALRFLYERFGSRLLEANVRAFLGGTNKVNEGAKNTLRFDPERFLAYNNGIVIVADDAHLQPTKDGAPGIAWLKGMQIVNGGQTTASIYFTKRRHPETELSKARVPAKIIVLRSRDGPAEEALVSNISRFANTQTAVKLSDLSANKPFHVELERLAMRTYCPDGVGRWFYERAAGGYTTMLAREGTTPAKLRQLKDAIPSSRRITKTELGKYLHAWDQKPELVSLGSQKNFDRFMAALGDDARPADDAAGFKRMVAKAILYKKVQSLVRPIFPAYQGYVGIYLVSLLAARHGNELDLDAIWASQDLSAALKAQLQVWAREVHGVMEATARGRMISMWARQPDCWAAVKSMQLSPPSVRIPELRFATRDAVPA